MLLFFFASGINGAGLARERKNWKGLHPRSSLRAMPRELSLWRSVKLSLNKKYDTIVFLVSFN